jgi:hypothetical protein
LRKRRRILAKRVALFFGRLLLWLLISAVALAASAVLHLRTDLARRAARDILNDLVSGEIRGRLAVGRIEELGPGRVVARHAALFDPEGRRIVTADRLVLVPDLDRLLKEGTLRFESAVLQEGYVRFVRTESGLPTLLRTFESARPAPPEPEPSGEPLHAIVDGMELSGVTVYGDFLALEGLRVEKVRLRGKLDIAREVEFRVDSASGTFTRPFGFEGRVDDLAGVIGSDPSRGVRLELKASRGQERATASIVYAPPVGKEAETGEAGEKGGAREPAGGAGAGTAEPELDLHVLCSPISPDTLAGLGFEWARALDAPFTGTFAMKGPVGDLGLSAQVQSRAGSAEVNGTISDDQGVSIAVSTDGLELEKLAARAPAVRAAGEGRLEMAPDEERPRVVLQVEPLVYSGVAVPAFEARGVLEEERLRIDSITSRARGTRIGGRGSVGFDGKVDMRLRASVPEVGRESNLREQLPGAQGRLEADLRVITAAEGRRRLDFDGRVVLHDFRQGPLTARRLELRGSAHGDPDLPRLNLKVNGTEVKVSGYPLGDPVLTVQGGPSEYTAVGHVTLQGKDAFHLDARISADRRSFTLNAEQIELFVGEGSWRGTARNLRLVKNESVSLELLRLANRSQRLEVNGTVRFRGPDEIIAQLQDFDLEAVRALLGEDFPVEKGRADTRVELRGDLENPQLLVQGALREGGVFNLEDLQGVYFVTYQDGSFEVDAEAQVTDRGLVNVTGSGTLDPTVTDPWQLLDSALFGLTFSADGLDLTLIEQVTGEAAQGWSGRLSGKMEASGDRRNPRLQGQVRVQSLALPGIEPLSVEADIDYRDTSLNIRADASDARGPLGSATLDSRIDLQELQRGPAYLKQKVQEGSWTLSGNTALRGLDSLPFAAAGEGALPLALATEFQVVNQQGAVGAEVGFEAQWTEPFRSTPCAGVRLPSLSGRAVLYRGQTHFTASAYLDQQRFASLEGSVGTEVEHWLRTGELTRPGALSLGGQVEVESFQGFPWLCEWGEGELSASFDLHDLFTDKASGDVNVFSQFLPLALAEPEKRPWKKQEQKELRPCGADPVNATISLHADEERMEISGNLSGCGGGSALVIGQIPVRWSGERLLPQRAADRPLDLKAELDSVQLRPLLRMIPGVHDGSASASGSLRASGKRGQARLDGSVTVRSGEIKIVATGQQLTDLSGRFILRGDWLQIERLSASDGEGWLRTSGGVGFEGLVPNSARLALAARNFPVRREGVDLAWLSGGAQLETEIGPRRAASSLYLQKLEVRLPEESGRSLRALDPHPDIEIVGLEEEAVRAGSPYIIQINVDGSEGFWVRRTDFAARVEAALDVIYVEPELRVGGYVDFQRGNFEVVGKSFDINQGSLTFDGSAELNPEVALTATWSPDSAGSSPVVVTVRGTMQQPEISFISEECEGDQGGLAMLVSGRCAIGESDVMADAEAQQEAMQAAMWGGVLTLGTSGVRNKLGGLIPKPILQSRQRAYSSDRFTRIGAGVNADSLIPPFLRGIVKGAYLESAYASPSSQGSTTGDQGEGTDAVDATTNEEPGTGDFDFLLELRFPYDLVWSGKIAPPQTWGTDILWEP